MAALPKDGDIRLPFRFQPVTERELFYLKIKLSNMTNIFLAVKSGICEETKIITNIFTEKFNQSQTDFWKFCEKQRI